MEQTPRRPIPFVLFGDLPGQPTGLSRILTDLATRLYADCGTLGIELVCVGYAPWKDLPRRGAAIRPSVNHQYEQWAFSDLTDWGASALTTAYRHWFGKEPGIVLSCWDPSRCHALLDLDLPVAKWGYFAIDAENIHGTISGPAAAAVRGYERVLAYTKYGSTVLGKIMLAEQHLANPHGYIDGPTQELRSPAHLPHGIDTNVFAPNLTDEEYRWALGALGPAFTMPSLTPPYVLGCVATNQPRKDLGLYFQILKGLKDAGYPIHGWLHIDRQITEAWSVPQLALDFDLGDHLTVTEGLSDRHLACLYALSAATVAVGRGEGFGYPIIESLACGCPVVGVNYAGGGEITPMGWRIPPLTYHLEGPYALKRPIMSAFSFVEVLKGILELRASADWRAVSASCQAQAERFQWPRLWPQWRGWIEEGVRQWRASNSG